MYRGDSCIPQNVLLGVFDGPNDMYEVTVSDAPCTDRACPKSANTVVCERSASKEPEYKMNPNNLEKAGIWYFFEPLTHDCKGARGQYVRIQLRGEGRIFDAQVEVNRAQPQPATSSAGSGSMVCVGVEARLARTLPIPQDEYITSKDPSDPGD